MKGVGSLTVYIRRYAFSQFDDFQTSTACSATTVCRPGMVTVADERAFEFLSAYKAFGNIVGPDHPDGWFHQRGGLSPEGLERRTLCRSPVRYQALRTFALIRLASTKIGDAQIPPRNECEPRVRWKL